ncbi:MAG: SH3 domain-containing protein [Anaerolineae bacterium]|nr:SH3 domain-containing protein [Anaerolineae bacterium]
MPAASLGPDQQLAQPIVIVNTSFLNVRSGPGAIYSIVGTLPGGVELAVMGRNNDATWWQVQSPYGMGWVYAEFVIPRGDFRAVPVVRITGATFARPTAAVTGTPATVYVAPDSMASVLGLALMGSDMPITGQTADGAWWQIETNVGLGWVMQEAVALRGDATMVPVVTANTGAVVMPGSDADLVGMYGRPVALHYRDGDMTVKTAPDYDAEGVGELRQYDRVEVLDFSDDGEFALILFMGDRMGWIIVDEVAISDPSDWRTQVWFSEASFLDLRAAPTMESEVLATVPSMSRLVVVNDAEGGWLQVAHANGTGWVPGTAVDIIRNGPRTAPAGQGGGGAQLSGNIVQPSAAGLVAAPPAALARNYVIVNTSFLNIRSGPGAQFTVVQTVRGGTELNVTAATPDTAWMLVQGDFGSGWVNAEFVIFRGNYDALNYIRYEEAVAPTTQPEVIVSAPINVYQGVGIDSGLLGTAPGGMNLRVIGRTLDGNWLQVETSQGNGWVLVSTVTFRGNIAQVPIVG